jgi:hypothetical protein
MEQECYFHARYTNEGTKLFDHNNRTPQSKRSDAFEMKCNMNCLKTIVSDSDKVSFCVCVTQLCLHLMTPSLEANKLFCSVLSC